MSAVVQSQAAALLERCDGLSVKLERCSKMISLWAGYGAVYHLVAKEISNGKRRNLILKDVKPPHDSGISHERKLHSYKVEASFYTDVAPILLQGGLNIATPYIAEENISDDGGSMHLILSDLRDHFPNQHRPMDLAHAKAALSWLASFHAAFWKQPLPGKLWKQGTFWHLETRQEELAAMEPEWRDLQRAAQYISDELADTSKYPTIVMGDAKGANILFSSNDSIPEAAFYDFQYCGGGEGVKDVAYLLCSTVESKVVQQNEEELLRHYHSELIRRLSPEAAEEYTYEVMVERLNFAISDFVRFMAGWGWWGNTSWASQKCRNHLKTLKL